MDAETVESSRSAIVARRKCKMRRFIEVEWGGHGLSPVGAAMPLVGGIALHNILAEVLQAAWMRQEPANAAVLDSFEQELDVIIDDGLTAYITAVREAGGFINQDKLPASIAFLVAEQSCLLEALVRGWVRYRLPDILEHYDVVEIEREHKVELAPGFRMPLRVDVLLRAKQGGQLVVLDYKTMAYERQEWADSLRNSEQTLLYTPAIEKLYEEPCAGVQYEGLFKGARKRGTKAFADRKIQQSVLCYGYTDGKTWTTEGTTKKGWTKQAVWEHMAVKDWVDNHVSSEDLQAMFQVVPVTRPTPWAMKHEVLVIAKAERDWARDIAPLVELSIVSPEELPEVLTATIEKSRDACLAYGQDNRCPFWSFCNDRTVAADPIGSGEYKVREDHHAEKEAEAA
jgi:hypothetical protein